MTIIDDHTHTWETRGRWRTGTCATCGQPVHAHLSWGQSVAVAVGGDPLDYITPLPEITLLSEPTEQP